MNPDAQDDGRAERNLDLAFEIARDVVEDPERYPEDFVVLPLEDDLLTRVLTRERTRVLQVLRDHGPYASVRALAQELDRDPSRVGRDLQLLEHLGLVELERRGRAKRVSGTGRPILVV